MDKQEILENARKIFEQGSTTYYNAAQFFPEVIREDVTILYSFVRISDNFVDATPQQPEKFFHFKDLFLQGLSGQKTEDLVIDSFIELMSRKKIDPKVLDLFFKAMEQDLNKKSYETLEEVEEYMGGSAEVIGLMMANIMELPPQSFHYAKQLGKAMQFINFIRDINYDLTTLNRVYIPSELLNKYDLENLKKDSVMNSPKKFNTLIRDLIQLYFEWQVEAEMGFKFIPKECLVPIKTASDMYKWTANQIYTNPFIIYQERLKPPNDLVIETAKKNSEQL